MDTLTTDITNSTTHMRCLITYQEQYDLIKEVLGMVQDTATSEDNDNPATAQWLEDVDLALFQVQQTPHHPCTGNPVLNRAIDRILQAVEIVAGNAELDGMSELTELGVLALVIEVFWTRTSDLK